MFHGQFHKLSQALRPTVHGSHKSLSTMGIEPATRHAHWVWLYDHLTIHAVDSNLRKLSFLIVMLYVNVNDNRHHIT